MGALRSGNYGMIYGESPTNCSISSRTFLNSPAG